MDEDYSYIEEYCTNLIKNVNKADLTKLVGHNNEIQELHENLLRRDKPNAV